MLVVMLTLTSKLTQDMIKTNDWAEILTQIHFLLPLLLPEVYWFTEFDNLLFSRIGHGLGKPIGEY